MIKIRDLLNPKILNNEDYVGFYGDSEYTNEDGELVMGAWRFILIYDGWLRNHEYLTLDDEIDESLLTSEDSSIEVFNDNHELCLVEFHYNKTYFPRNSNY